MATNFLKRFFFRGKQIINNTDLMQKSGLLSHINVCEVMEKIEYSKDI